MSPTTPDHDDGTKMSEVRCDACGRAVCVGELTTRDYDGLKQDECSDCLEAETRRSLLREIGAFEDATV